MALRLGLFYLVALTIVVSFVPWTEIGAKVVAESPFVKRLRPHRRALRRRRS